MHTRDSPRVAGGVFEHIREEESFGYDPECASLSLDVTLHTHMWVNEVRLNTHSLSVPGPHGTHSEPRFSGIAVAKDSGLFVPGANHLRLAIHTTANPQPFFGVYVYGARYAARRHLPSRCTPTCPHVLRRDPASGG